MTSTYVALPLLVVCMASTLDLHVLYFAHRETYIDHWDRLQIYKAPPAPSFTKNRLVYFSITFLLPGIKIYIGGTSC